MTLTGGCRCGACRYTLEQADVPIGYACHCLDCQTMSGSAFTLQALVPLSRLSLTGNLAEWANAKADGRIITQYFCARCHTRLYSTGGKPGVAILRMGTLDDSAKITPAVHMWTKRKQPWIRLADDAETYEEAIPSARAQQIVAPNFA